MKNYNAIKNNIGQEVLKVVKCAAFKSVGSGECRFKRTNPAKTTEAQQTNSKLTIKTMI